MSDDAGTPARYHPRTRIPRDDSDDPIRAKAIDRVCHCHPITERELRQEIVTLAAEYHSVHQAWLVAQLQAWEWELTSSLALTARRTLSASLAERKDALIRKLHEKCRTLGMRVHR